MKKKFGHKKLLNIEINQELNTFLKNIILIKQNLLDHFQVKNFIIQITLWKGINT